MGALVHMKPKPHEKIKIGERKGAAQKMAPVKKKAKRKG